MVVVGSAGNQVSVDDAGFVYEGASTNFQIELALWHSSHASTANAVGMSRDFHAVTDGGDRFVLFEKIAGDADEVLVVANVFRCPATGKKDTDVVANRSMKSTLRIVPILSYSEFD